ncbi:hypothetical protein [Chryseosolibacter indicus]|uniref:PEP-CTERM sorting domain-containing protein n=1 Tax=Chryseosolibacter indicus TaxID=2782351 RepID=A0ABS5VVI4_9BACT|nr:hypothetical protein [Chryseosolibacter indicus]MBT1705351.1 hypothetical protein [Chryseosolibacter indicus]
MIPTTKELKKRLKLFIRLFIVLVGVAFPCFSQPPGNPGSGGNGGIDNPDVPITGIEILIGLGGLYGARKVHANLKKKQ